MVRMNRRGMILTVGALMVALLVVLVAKTSITAHQGDADAFAAGIDRVADTHESLERVVRDVLAGGGLSVLREEERVVIRDRLGDLGIAARLAAVKAFAEEEDPTVRLDMSSLAAPSFTLLPQNSTYTHDGGILLAGSGAQAYAVDITTSEDVSCTVSSAPGPLSFNVSVKGINGSCERTLGVDPGEETRVSVDGGNMTVTLEDGTLAVTGIITADVNVTLVMRTHAAFLPAGIVNVTLPRGGVGRTGPLRLA